MKSWLEKQRNIVDFTLSSLLRRRGKYTALFIVYTLIVFLLGSVMFFAYAMKREACLLLDEAPEMIVQRTAAGRYDLIPLRYAGEIRKIRGVSSVSARLWGYYYDSRTGANYTVMASGQEGGDGQITIGNGISRSLQVYRGDMMTFRSFKGVPETFEVKELLSSRSELVSSDLVLMSERDFRGLFGTAGEYATDLSLRVRNQRELQTIAEKIAERLPDTRVITRDEIQRTYASIFDWRSGIVMTVLFGSVLAFIIFAWDKASGLSAEEKKEIGVLKAIGWETSDIIVMKFWEGAVISFLSFSMGIVLAYFHIFLTSASLFGHVLKGWSVLYPSYRLTPFVNVYEVATLFFITVVPYTVATIIPSWRAAITDPDAVMRS